MLKITLDWYLVLQYRFTFVVSFSRVMPFSFFLTLNIAKVMTPQIIIQCITFSPVLMFFFFKLNLIIISSYFYMFHKYQGSRCRSPMSQFAIFFLDWRLKSASGDFLGTQISLCKFIDNHYSLCTVTKINKLLTIDFRK